MTRDYNPSGHSASWAGHLEKCRTANVFADMAADRNPVLDAFEEVVSGWNDRHPESRIEVSDVFEEVCIDRTLDSQEVIAWDGDTPIARYAIVRSEARKG